MKNLVLIATLALGLTTSSFASNTDGNTESSYSSNIESAHAKIEYKDVQLPVSNQHAGTAVLFKAVTPSNNWLLVFHDKWGVTNNVKNEAHTLWKDLKNVNVLVVDLHDGIQPKGKANAMRLLVTNNVDRDRAIIKSAIEFAGEDAKIGTLGWSYGASWALQTALMSEEKDVACVMYYGMPELNTEKLAKLNTDVLAIYGTQDTYITPTIANMFEEKMEVAGKKLTQLEYQNKGNFADRHSVKYNYTDASDAYGKVLNYLMKKYK